MTSARLYIAIPVHNRLAIAQECIPTVRAGIAHEQDAITLYDDGSSEGGNNAAVEMAILACANSIQRSTTSIGIERQRRQHFLDFSRLTDFTHLYLCDADAIHDPNWRSTLLRLQAEHGGAPICGYDTTAHSSLAGNTIEDSPASEVIWRKFAPGISYLLTRAHAEVIVKALPHLPEHWDWDWSVPSLLGNRFAVTRQSVVEHVGVGGLHHAKDAGWEGGDRATNPTQWLVQKRREVVGRLSKI